MRFLNVAKKVSAIVLVLALAACANTYATNYKAPAQAANWRVADVVVAVPTSLKVSEEKSSVPTADIVWREDKGPDRYSQVAAIMKTAISRGVAGLHGSRPVRLEVTVSRFHAMTFEAEQRHSAGIHSVKFTVVVRDARTGEVIEGPTPIDASFPALGGKAMADARARGVTQKSMIINHVAATMSGWVGTGPDIRKSYTGYGA